MRALILRQIRIGRIAGIHVHTGQMQEIGKLGAHSHGDRILVPLHDGISRDQVDILNGFIEARLRDQILGVDG